MNGFQGPEHLWFLHEKYFGLFESEDVIMRDSDLSSVFYILSSMKKLHSDRPFSYWITYEGNDINGAKKAINDYHEKMLFFGGTDIDIEKYVKNIL